jgi:RimJ/RimL family protein N-acetyltransferase
LLAEAGELRARTWSDAILIVLQRPAGGTAATVPDVSIREADASDARAYERDIGTDLAATVVTRLSEPTSSCWIAETGGRMVHSSWVATESAWVGEIERVFIVPPGDAYIYESFTRPEMRGRGIYPAVLLTISERLGAGSVRRLWIAVEATNPSSLRAIQKAGFISAFEIGLRHRFGRSQVRIPPGAVPGFRKRDQG